MSMLAIEPKVYNDGRTKQAFADSCDINKILKRAQKVGSLAHVQKYDSVVYGEFENFDLLEAYGKLEKARSIFADLPSEVRREFNQDALAFAGFAANPENRDKLGELIPALAEPGRQFPNPVKRGIEPEGSDPATPVPGTPEAVVEPPVAPAEAPASSST